MSKLTAAERKKIPTSASNAKARAEEKGNLSAEAASRIRAKANRVLSGR